MKKTLVVSVLTLAVLGGVASADHGHGRWNRGGWRASAGWSGGVRVTAPRVVVLPRVVVQQPRRVSVQPTRVVRRPIYVQRPVIRYRYTNYYARPSVLVENYAPMTGYYWVAGSWGWNGYEWMWTAGHYEPDPNYIEPGYAGASYEVNAGYDYDDDCDHDQY